MSIQCPMWKSGNFWLAIGAAYLLCIQASRAQGLPSSGLYQISSGRFTECCGIGGQFIHPLPDASQGFVELRVDPQTNFAQMTFLAQDMHTVFSIGYPGGGFTFNFSNGIVFSDHIQFGEPFPPPGPDQPYFSYTVSNSADALRINGSAIVPCDGCADIPTEFEHTNVVAVLMPASPVIIDRIQRDAGSLRFHFTGEPLYDYTVESTESLVQTNWLALATYRAKASAIDVVTTNSFTNAPARFFRVRKEPCNCR